MFLIQEIADSKGTFVQIYDLKQAQETTFATPGSFSFQVGFAVDREAKTYQPHVHTDVERTIKGTSEFIFVVDGCMDVVFLDELANPCAKVSLKPQMAFLQLRGGHAISTRPNTRFFELKQGPYLGRDVDKYSVDFRGYST